MAEQKKICFVIAPIGEPDSKERKRSDELLNFIVRPVVESASFGYKVVRADEIGQPGLITNQVVEYLRDADLVVADLSDANPNVVYELAVRHCVRKPAINVLFEGQKLPFDLGNSRTIFYNQTLAGGETCKLELAKTLKAIEENPSIIESPVSSAIDLGR